MLVITISPLLLVRLTGKVTFLLWLSNTFLLSFATRQQRRARRGEGFQGALNVHAEIIRPRNLLDGKAKALNQ
jgi:hypothetical protein